MNTLMNNPEGMYIGYLHDAGPKKRTGDRLQVSEEEMQSKFISGKIDRDTCKLKICIAGIFEWQINVNHEKGTAGGNMKVDFPVKSPLLIACICISVAVLCAKTCITAYLVPAIFASFAAYQLVKCWRILRRKINLLIDPNPSKSEMEVPVMVRVKK